MKKRGPVAIIGAGISGLSCAQALVDAGVEVRVFEQSREVGGRCATRLWQGHLVDHGVQYFTAQSTDFKKELLTRLRQFRPIISPILDSEEKVVTSPLGPRFYVLQGNNYLAQVLARGLDVRLNTAVGTLTFGDAGIECLGESYPAVVSAVPGPQTSRLFGLSLPPAEYEPSLVALLEYANDGFDSARPCYGRWVTQGSSPLLASYCENNKAGRVVGNKTVFVAQASATFSREHADLPPESYLPELVNLNADLWRIPVGSCTASSIHYWRYGRPWNERNRIDLPRGGFRCGDSRSESYVEDVWLDGRRAAAEVLVYLNDFPDSG